MPKLMTDDSPALDVGPELENPEKLELAERLAEAILFASPLPVEEPALAERLPKGTDIARVMSRLQDRYRSRGVHVMRVAGGWVFQTAPDLAAALTVEREEIKKLTRAQVETLAIIAYHQPITRPEIERMRGVSLSSGVMDALLDLGWIRPGRRRDAPGKPLTWVTSNEFLLHFGLNAVSDLPGIKELQQLGLLDEHASSISDFTHREEELELPSPAASVDPDAEAAADLGQHLDPDEGGR
jgi:segregation and condensation protein B